MTSLELDGIDELRVSNIARWTENFTPAPDWYLVNSDFTIDFWVHLTKVQRDGEDMIFVNGERASSLDDLFNKIIKDVPMKPTEWDR